jgi:hypothetical protein
MSKTRKEQPRSKRADESPEKAIQRITMREAAEDIKEALRTSREASCVHSD